MTTGTRAVIDTAKTDDRLFAPFPIEMDEHPKIIGLSDAAFRAIFEATFYSRRMISDGFLDERVVLKRWGQAVADELSSNDPERPSWVRVDGPKPGWRIHDFEKHHPLRADIDAIKDARAQSGRRGGQRSGQVRGSKREANVKQNGSKTNPETETETTTSKASVRAALEHDFDEFWNVYPRKEGKQAARRKYETVRKTVAAGPILDGARAYALMSLGVEKQHVKMAQGWLNDGRWADELQPSIPQPPKGDGALAHEHRWLPDGTCMLCEVRRRDVNPF